MNVNKKKNLKRNRKSMTSESDSKKFKMKKDVSSSNVSTMNIFHK